MSTAALNVTVAAVGAAVQQAQVVFASVAASTPPTEISGRIWMEPPYPPAAESYAKCVVADLLIQTSELGYRALMRGRKGPHDHGIIGRP